MYITAGIKKWITLVNLLFQNKTYQVIPSYWSMDPFRLSVLKVGINGL